MRKSRFIVALLCLMIVSLCLPAIGKKTWDTIPLSQSQFSVWSGYYYNECMDRTIFLYQICVKDDPALSHFVVELPQCCSLQIEFVSFPDFVEMGLDPTTGIDGIKWEVPVEAGYCMMFAFHLEGDWTDSIGRVEIGLKGGKVIALGEVWGPVCP